MNRRHNLNRLAYFVAVIEEGTITAAADRLGISKAVVSKQLLTLEDELNVSLVVRNSRYLIPTDIGQQFYQRAISIINQAEEAFDVVTSGLTEPKGLMRVTAPIDYGMIFLSPLIAKFVQKYPKVEIDLILSDEKLNPVEQRFDLAFRVGWLADSNNIARKIGSFRELVVCAPGSAIAQNTAAPKDLAHMPFIRNTNISSHAKLGIVRVT